MFWADFGAYDVQFDAFGDDCVFLGGIGSERRKASHASENQITTGVQGATLVMPSNKRERSRRNCCECHRKCAGMWQTVPYNVRFAD